LRLGNFLKDFKCELLATQIDIIKVISGLHFDDLYERLNKLGVQGCLHAANADAHKQICEPQEVGK